MTKPLAHQIKVEDQLKKWIESKEGQKKIQKAINQASVLPKEIRESVRISLGSY